MKCNINWTMEISWESHPCSICHCVKKKDQFSDCQQKEIANRTAKRTATAQRSYSSHLTHSQELPPRDMVLLVPNNAVSPLPFHYSIDGKKDHQTNLTCMRNCRNLKPRHLFSVYLKASETLDLTYIREQECIEGKMGMQQEPPLSVVTKLYLSTPYYNWSVSTLRNFLLLPFQPLLIHQPTCTGIQFLTHISRLMSY